MPGRRAAECGHLTRRRWAPKRAVHATSVEDDDRGYIDIVGRANTGMHILELTGPARQVANTKAGVK